LYFYDDDPSLEHRYRSYRKKHYEKDKEVIERLVAILRGNPYSDHLRTMGQIKQIDDYCVTLNLDQKLDQRVYNVPINFEVAAVWIEGSERRGQFQHSLILQGKNRQMYGIRSYNGCYDPLSYPMFFPRGELGCHIDIPKANVNMEEVMAARPLYKARSDNNEDEPG